MSGLEELENFTPDWLKGDDPEPEAVRPSIEHFGAIKLADLTMPAMTGRFRWCPELGWLKYTLTKWKPVPTEVALNEVARAVKAYQVRLISESGTGLAPAQLTELRTLSSGSTQNHALRLLSASDEIYTEVGQFDQVPMPGAPWLLPCANGWTIELHPDGSKIVRKTEPSDLNTRVACDYDPEAVAPLTVAALAEYQPHLIVRTFMLQMWARGLSGLGVERFLVNLGEQGGNGKSTMQGVLSAVANDYAFELPVEVIVGRGGAVRTNFRSELAQMRGARLVFCDEPEEGSKYNLGTLKKITGGGTLQGRGMGKEAVTYEARILFQMASNNRPSWSEDGGMKRRYIEIAWDYVVSEGQLREAFKEELKAEASGFLNVILDHWVGDTPVELPTEVREQTESGQLQSSPIYDFVQNYLKPSPEGSGITTRSSVIYEAYRKSQGSEAIASNTFSKEMKRFGYAAKPTKAANVYPLILIEDQ